MSAEQLTLAPVHRGDGAESRIAAAKQDARRQFDLVLACLHDADKPLTDDEIAERCGLLRHAAGTRRGVAVKQQLVRKAGRGTSAMGNPAATWALTSDGVAYVARLRRGAA